MSTKEKKTGKVESQKYGLTFWRTRKRVRIYSETIHAIGDPKFIRFLFNPEGKKLAIQGRENPDHDTFITAALRHDQEACEISSMSMLNIVWRVCGWKKDCNYRVYGKVYKDRRIAEFDLTTAHETAGTFEDQEAAESGEESAEA